METTNATTLAHEYLAGWNTSDPLERRRLVEEVWAPEARSVDPLADVTGHDAIDAMLAAIQAQYPGHRFELDGEAATHHDVAHWAWSMVGPTGERLLGGRDVATLTPDGRISFLAGFFES